MMPIIDGFETCRQIKVNDDTFDIPIIFMTALAETRDKLEAFDLGAVDYIVKPFQKEEVVARVKAQLQLRNLTRALENQNRILKQEITHRREIEKSLFTLNQQLEETNLILKTEIEQRKESEAQLQQAILVREQTELQLKQSLREKEILLKEIHHRVKNNLFVASSLLELQTDYIEEPRIIKMFSDSQNRIYSMALIHEHLYSNHALDKLNFKEYIQDLTARVIDSYDNSYQKIQFFIEAESIFFDLETAHPCGLIINELIANAIEHGFKDKNEGTIWIYFHHINSDKLELIIKDNGWGFPENLNLETLNSLGLQLVQTLVKQLEGNIEIIQHCGAEVKIQFAQLNYQRRF
jgi:two-component sensor histidine kinase